MGTTIHHKPGKIPPMGMYLKYSMRSNETGNNVFVFANKDGEVKATFLTKDYISKESIVNIAYSWLNRMFADEIMAFINSIEKAQDKEGEEVAVEWLKVNVRYMKDIYDAQLKALTESSTTSEVKQPPFAESSPYSRGNGNSK